MKKLFIFTFVLLFAHGIWAQVATKRIKNKQLAQRKVLVNQLVIPPQNYKLPKEKILLKK
jgi:hypothetical protein